MPRSILFVCHGNICRSPAAEAVTRKIAAERGLDLIVDSAGTGHWHAGEPPDTRMQAAAAKAGYDLSSLRARQVTAEDYQSHDLFVAMDRKNMADLMAMRPRGADTPVVLLLPYGPSGRTEVPDPYHVGNFEAVLDLIIAATEGMLDRFA